MDDNQERGQFLKPHLLKMRTEQPQPPVSVLQGKVNLIFDLKIRHVGRRSKRA